jgi:hypothetical protein
VATIAAVLAILLVVRPDGSPNPRPAGPGGPPTFPTDYWFGPASLPGYTLTSIGLSATGQSATYERTAATGTATSVALTGLHPTPQELAAITALPTVQIGAVQGHYGDTRALGKAGPGPDQQAMSWPLDAHRWIAITANSAGSTELAALARSVRPITDDHVALVKISYLPAHLRFTYTAQYLHQQQMLSPDGTVGTGYRTLAFTARGLSINAHTTLDIVSVLDPFVDLTRAAIDDLPTFNNGPWEKTTVAGHVAWVAPHDVLIQWGTVQIGVSSSQTTGDTSTPLLSKTELLKIAAGLTVADSNAVGHGYPLATAVPANAFH